MYIHRKLHKLRQKPDDAKERIVVGCMIVAVPIILSVWSLNLDVSAFKLSDAKDFLIDTKAYFSNSQSYVVNTKSPEEFFKSVNANAIDGTKIATSTDVSTSTIKNTSSNI